jgi:prefoldin beta subunit
MTKKEEEAQELLGKLQLMQQRMQLFAAQKQQIQLQLAEVDNALSEIEKTDKPIFRLVGELLIEKDKAGLKKDLSEKKEDLGVRLKSLDKQEMKSREQATEFQTELSKKLK